MVANKYGYEGTQLCKFSAYGSPKVRVAKLVEVAIAGANSIKVDQASGWQPGDSIVLSQTDLTSNLRQDIAVIAPGYVPGGLTVPLVGTLTYPHSLECVVGNLTSNVTFKAAVGAFGGGAFHIQGGQFSTPSSRNLRHVAFEDLGGVYPAYGVSFRYAANYSSTNWPQPYGELRDLAITRRQPQGPIVQTENCSATTPMEFVDCVFAHVHPTEAYSADVNVANHTRFTRCYHFGVSISFGGQTDVSYIDCHLLARGRDNITTSKGMSSLVRGLKMGGWNTNYGVITHFNAQANCNDLIIEDCEFGVTYPLQPGAPVFYMQSLDARITTTATNCSFGASVIEPSVNSMNCLSTESYVRIVNKNKDPLQQFEYKKQGVTSRNNSVAYRGTSSLSMRPNAVGRVCERNQPIACSTGSSVRVVGYVKMDTIYLNGNDCTAPTVTLSGLGAPPALYTMALNTNWQFFDFTIANNSGSDGFFVLTFSATPKSVATGTVYMDGVPDAPFVTKVRHYGFLFNESSPIRTVNTVTQANEATAAAYTGVTISPTAPKITVTVGGSADTWRKVYDYYQAWACLNLASAVLLTSADGINFTLPLTCKIEWDGMPINGTLNGGWLQLPAPGVHSYSLSGSKIEFMGAGTYDMSNSKFSGTVEFVNTSGGAVTVQTPIGINYTNTGPDVTVVLPSSNVFITAPSLISGSRVQLYNITDGVEMVNTVLAGDGLSYELPFVEVKVVRLRSDHASKLPLETIGVLASAGLTFLDVQSEDNVYLSNGVDGSLVTEFAPDGPNIQVDINDVDGVTDVVRLYAWLQWYMTTEEGVRSVFFGSVSAIDTANYVIDQAKANIKLDNISPTPLRVIGGNLTRRDGSTVIAASSGSIQMDPGKAYVVETGVSGLTTTEANMINQISALALETTAQAAAKNAALAAALSA